MTSPSTYIVGQVILLSDLITNPRTGAAVVDGSDAVTVYKPNGQGGQVAVSPTPTVTHPGIDDPNAYDAQITLDVAGWWEYVFNSAGAGAGAGRKRFYVSPVP